MAKVLVIDDAMFVRMVMEKNLTEYGHNVICASNGMEGIEMAQEEQPDIILMDINMPIMNGYEATEKLKQDEITKDIPIIMVTTQSRSKDVIEAYNLGVADYIAKPFKYKIINAKIHRALLERNI